VGPPAHGVTTGLLVWLAIDATIEAVELSGQGPQAFGGPALVFLGAALAYLTLSARGVVRSRCQRPRASTRAACAWRC